MLKTLLKSTKGYRLQLFILSLFINLLLLTPSWYMLEVYDRVLNSQNYRTLLMLSLLVVFLYLILEMLEWIRSLAMQEIASHFSLNLYSQVFDKIFEAKINQSSFGTPQALSDLNAVEELINSPATTALIDIPFCVITFIILSAIDLNLLYISFIGAAIMALITFTNHRFVLPLLSQANQSWMTSQRYLTNHLKNAEVIKSMGMLDRIQTKWDFKHSQFIQQQAEASFRASQNIAFSKFIQMLQGSAILGFACWLTLQGKIPQGGSIMIIASILGGRALAPLILIMTHWRSYLTAKISLSRLEDFFSHFPNKPDRMRLPPPEGFLQLEQVFYINSISEHKIINGVSFNLISGGSLAIVGPTGSGKTTLAKLMMGVLPATNGKINLDGADIYQWDKDHLGGFIGYLPQGVELFDGTVGQNIARFGELNIEALYEAANITGLKDFIENLPQKFDTHIGEEGTFLSSGQRQRIALARAIYGSPKFVLLDEPNANLDEAGDQALLKTLVYLREKKTTLIVITHRPNVLNILEHMMVLIEGQIYKFGLTQDVLNELNLKK
jgi:ATP-binding cassette subfamily C exporter for protease/lipase